MCPPGVSQRGRGGRRCSKGGINVPPVVLWSCAAIAAPIACPLLICAAPFIGAWKASKMVRKSEWYRTRQRKRECQPPKPQKRKRTLSISDDFGVVDGRTKMATKSQLQSLLFKLPYELRRQVYEEVVGHLAVHVIKVDDKLCSYPCRGTDGHANIRQHCWAKPARLSLTGLPVKQGGPFQYHDPGIGMMGLLMSCRRIYTEFVDILYSEPTFVFGGYQSMLSFCASILPDRFNSIKSVHFNNIATGLLPTARQLGFQGSYMDQRTATTRNNRLPVLSIDDIRHGALNHILMLLKAMESLRTLAFDLDFFGMGPNSEAETTVLPSSMLTLKGLDLRVLEVRIHAEWASYRTPPDLVKRMSREMPFIEVIRNEDMHGSG